MKPIYLLIFCLCCSSIHAWAQPSNNEPCDAILLSNGVQTCGTNMDATHTIDPDSLPCPDHSGADVWYRLIVNAPDNFVTFSFTGVEINGDGQVLLGRWSSGCSGSFTYQTPAFCGSLGSIVYSCLSPGTYYMMVSSSAQNAGEFCVTATVSEPPQGCASNDVCPNAVILTTPPTGGQTCVSGCNTGACGESNLNYQGCRLDLQATVWHTFTTGPQANLLYNLSVSGGVYEISLFSGACGNHIALFLCQSAINSIVLPPNTTYYVAISTQYQNAGTYSLCLETFENPSVCAVNSSVEVVNTSYGSPPNGPYQQGEIVSFCLRVDSWDASQNNCQWLHGIVPLFGNGWDLSSFDPSGEPNLNQIDPEPVHMNEGYWEWHTEVLYNSVINPTTATRRIYTDPYGNIRICSINEPNCDPSYQILTAGATLPGGWFVCRQAGNSGSCPLNWGDGASCGPGHGPWSVCFDLKTKEFGEEDICEELTHDDVDCSVKFFTMADGETGSWAAFDCAGDIPAIHYASVQCCDTPIGNEDVDLICSGNSSNINLSSDQNPVSFKWTVSSPYGVYGASSGSGPGIFQNIVNTTLDRERVTYIVTPTNDSTQCVGRPFEVYVDVHPQINIDIETDPEDKLGCSLTPFELTANSSGGAGGDFSFIWSSGEPIDGPTIMVSPGVVGSFTYHVTVTDDNGCINEAQETIEVLDKILAKLELEKSVFSEPYSPKILSIVTNPSTIVSKYSWINPGPPTPEDQAFQLVNQSGYYAITITDINGCVSEDEMEIGHIQVINNSDMQQTDVYWGDVKILQSLEINNASPYILLEISDEDLLGIAPAGSSSNAEAFVQTNMNLPRGSNHMAMVAGIHEDMDYPISIFIQDSTRIIASDTDNIDIIFFQGSTNAPKLDIEMEMELLAENMEYGQFSNYVETIPTDSKIDLVDADEGHQFKFYNALFEIFKGQSITLFSGGIVNGEPGFELWAALSNGISFPLEELVAVNNISMITTYALHPNPVLNNVTTLTLNTIQECTQCVIGLMDMKGVFQKILNVDKLSIGHNNFNIELGGLSNGVYRVNIQCSQGLMSIPLIIIR